MHKIKQKTIRNKNKKIDQYQHLSRVKITHNLIGYDVKPIVFIYFLLISPSNHKKYIYPHPPNEIASVDSNTQT